jgi:hypothetical protein
MIENAMLPCLSCGKSTPVDLFGEASVCNHCMSAINDPKAKLCAHGLRAGECDDCDMAADFAHDAAREDRLFGRK